MSKEEFEQLIAQDPKKGEILQLVAEKIKLCGQQNEKAVYDTCAKLYTDSLNDYTHFRLNISGQIDLMRYQSFCQNYQDYILATLQKRLQTIVEGVEEYFQKCATQNSDENEKKQINNSATTNVDNVHQFKNDVITLLETYENTRLFIKGRIIELEDTLELLKLEKCLKDGYSPMSITLRANNYRADISIHINSDKAKRLFTDTYFPYFMDRFVENSSDITKINSEINYLRDLSSAKLIHKIVYDLYQIFIKYGKVSKCNKGDNSYDLKDDNGSYYSLDANISDWIYNLLKKFGYITITSHTLKTERNRYIKDCIRDKQCRNIQLKDFSLASLSFFL